MLLEERVRLLEKEVGEIRAGLDSVAEGGLARVFLIEHEHELVLREAELAWVRELVREIWDGTLDGIDGWRAFHTEPAATNEEE